jgi:hypothetical protein
METKTYCIHQICRPSSETITGMNENGWGNCFICQPDEANKNCTHYKPIVMGMLEAIEREHDI